jgi:hypothetical protein
VAFEPKRILPFEDRFDRDVARLMLSRIAGPFAGFDLRCHGSIVRMTPDTDASVAPLYLAHHPQIAPLIATGERARVDGCLDVADETGHLIRTGPERRHGTCRRLRPARLNQLHRRVVYRCWTTRPKLILSATEAG